MKTWIVCWLLCCGLWQQLLAQGLYPYLRHYTLQAVDTGPAEVNVLAQDPIGYLWLGTRQGLMGFDGKQYWSIAADLAEVSALLPQAAGRIYVGSLGDFGYLQREPDGHYTYTSLAARLPETARTGFQLVQRIIEQGGTYYFYSNENIFTYNPAKSDEGVGTYSPPTRNFTGLFVLAGRVLVNVAGAGLHELIQGRVQTIKAWDAWGQHEIDFVQPLRGSELLLCLTDVKSQRTRLYTLRAPAATPQPFASMLNGYIDRRGLSGAAVAGDRLVLATDVQGCFITNLAGTQTLAVLDSSTGLPYEHVYALAAAQGGDFWLAHGGGFSYVCAGKPLHDYSYMPGLTGQINQLYVHADYVYAATAEGLFALPASDYTPGAGIGMVQRPEALPADKPVDQAIVDRLKRTKQQRLKAKLATPRKKNVPKSKPTRAATKPVKLITTWVAGAATARWRRVLGIRYACNQLASVEGQLYAATFSGVFQLTGLDAKQVALAGKDVQQLLPSADAAMLYARHSSDSGPISILRAQGGRWQVQTLTNIQTRITDMALLPGGILWLDAGTAFLRVQPGSGSINKVNVPTHMANQLRSLVQVLGVTYCLTADAAYTWPADSLQRHAGLSQYLQNNARLLTSNTQQAWVQQGRDLLRIYTRGGQLVADTLSYLQLWDETPDHVVQAGKHLWLAQGRAIYRLGWQQPPPKAEWRSITAQVLHNNIPLPTTGVATLDAQQHKLQIRFFAPAYENPQNLQYQYWLEGLPPGWTDWDKVDGPSNTAFAGGSYTLHFRARNAWGQRSSTTSYAFVVPQPWYVRWWAIVTYVVVGAGLVLGLVRLRSRQLQKEKDKLALQVRQRTKELQEKNQALAHSIETIQLTQAQLVQSEKLAALGRLVASTAHEINSPISAIKATVDSVINTQPELLQQILQQMQHEPDAVRQAFFALLHQAQTQTLAMNTREERAYRQQLLNDLEQAGIAQADELAETLARLGTSVQIDQYLPLLSCAQATELVRACYSLAKIDRSFINISRAVDKTQRYVSSLKNYSYQKQGELPEDIDLHENIAVVLDIYQHELKRLHVHRQFGSLPIIKGYAQDLAQVWTNLIFNSIQALQGQGQLWLRTGVADTAQVYVEVADDGPGIPPDALPHIFDQFYTTKIKGEGTGLGLFICHNIVRHHQGSITVHSQPGNTVFRVVLAVAGPQITTPEAARILSVSTQNSA